MKKMGKKRHYVKNPERFGKKTKKKIDPRKPKV